MILTNERIYNLPHPQTLANPITRSLPRANHFNHLVKMVKPVIILLIIRRRQMSKTLIIYYSATAPNSSKKTPKAAPGRTATVSTKTLLLPTSNPGPTAFKNHLHYKTISHIIIFIANARNLLWVLVLLFKLSLNSNFFSFRLTNQFEMKFNF